MTIKVKAGVEYDYPLKVFYPSIPNDEVGKSKIVEIFSTDNSLIFPPNGKTRNTQRLQPIRKEP